MISENFADDMWEKYIQTADISNTQYRLVNAYRSIPWNSCGRWGIIP